MRIGMLADVYKPHVSGITNYISLNKTHLEELGHEVYVFTFGDEDYEDDETNVIRSPGLPLRDTGYYLSLRYSREARLLMKTMDVCHIHHPFVTGSLATRYCRPRGIPTVFTNHTRYDLYTQAYLPGLPDIVSDTALQAYIPSFFRAVDVVVAPSQGMRDVLVNFGVDVPVKVIPNGVDLSRYHQAIEPLSREQIGFSEDQIVLIYTGRLGPEKNLSFLLRCFAGVAQAYEHVRLLLIGDGPEKENLELQALYSGIQDKVHFAGMVPYENIPSYLAMADAFVTASITEVHPLSVIEAMASGLPVLGIQSPGVGDTVEDGETGFLAKKEDMAVYTAKMVRMVIDAAALKRMGEQARQAAEKYAIERTVILMLECYEEAIQKATNRKGKISARWLRWWDGLRR